MPEFTPAQNDAIDRAVDYVDNFELKRQEIFRLFGFAGTGKTTVLQEINRRISRRAMFMAFAGKAAMVLQSKGCANATTIHKSIYVPRGSAIKEYQEELAMWEAMPEGAEKVTAGKSLEERKQSLSRPAFVLKLLSEFPKETAFICDEVSQVNKEIGEDILSFGFPVIACGDPAQLKPVAGEGFFTNAKPDVLLTEIHRQEAGNPVLRLATAVRGGRALTLPYGSLGDSWIVRSMPPAEYAKFDQVLCGMNKTRQAANQAFRRMAGRTNVVEVGEKVICLQNNYEVGVMNGSTWIVTRTQPQTIGRFQYYRADLSSLDIPGDHLTNVLLHTMPFLEGTEHHQKFWTPMLTGKPEALVMTYGYAITVHKAQGSQWDNVALIDEWSRSDSSYPNWLYTGITRAAKRITIVRKEL